MHPTTRPLPRRAVATVLLTIPLLATACSDDDDTAPPPTSAVVQNTAPPTTETPTTVESSTTTNPPATTQPPATSSPAPTAATDDIEQAKQDVIAAAETAWHLFNEAKLDPTNEAKVQAALSAHTGVAQDSVMAIIETYRAEGRRSITFEPAPATIQILAESVRLDPTTASVTVESCVLNTNVLVHKRADGTDRVLDDSISSYLARETYMLVGDEWLEADGVVLNTYEGALTCDSGG